MTPCAAIGLSDGEVGCVRIDVKMHPAGVVADVGVGVGVGVGSCVVEKMGDGPGHVGRSGSLFREYCVERHKHCAIDCSGVIQVCTDDLLFTGEFFWRKKG